MRRRLQRSGATRRRGRPRGRACQSAHDDREQILGYATPHPAQGSRVRHRRLTQEVARTVTTQAGNLVDQRRNGRPRPRRRGLPRQTEHAHGGPLVFTREKARHGLGDALDGASSAEPARSISGNRPRSAPGRPFPRGSKERGKGSALQLGSERGLALGGGRRGQCATAIPENPSHFTLSRSPQRDPSPAHIPRLCAA
jgi:hypothetical protein